MECDHTIALSHNKQDRIIVEQLIHNCCEINNNKTTVNATKAEMSQMDTNMIIETIKTFHIIHHIIDIAN